MVPERVWEPSFARDLVEAGIEYIVLDDFHFKNAGLTDQDLFGSFLTEDDGRVLTVFPGSERLRYTIPFADPHETIQFLDRMAEEHPNAVAVFGDDGEKFGTWPETKKHVYTDRWLERFFDAVVANQEWIQSTTLSEAFDSVPAVGKVYLPDSSYREMTEWALPVTQQVEYDRVVREMEHDPRWPDLRRFVRGGLWRNFKVKYPEANEMYSRMMCVSRRLAQVIDEGHGGEIVEQARTELYRAQCNCGYWHGAFGGIYLPHLRNAVYHHLIAADGLLDRLTQPQGDWVEAKIDDFNFDSRQEVQLANDKLLAILSPACGGQMVELDCRPIRHNLLATLARRPEAYHRKVLARSESANGHVAHECILDLRSLKDTSGVMAEDVAKRLMDYGFHAPTLSFPVPNTLMVEPTESETLQELDRFIDAMIAIRAEIRLVENGSWPQDNNPLKHAPHTADSLLGADWARPYPRAVGAASSSTRAHAKYWPPVGRVDNVYGDRNLFCRCVPVSEDA